MKLNWKILLGSAALVGAAIYIIKKKKSKDSDCKLFDANQDLFVWDRPYKDANEEKDAAVIEHTEDGIKLPLLINTDNSLIAKESITSDWMTGDTGEEYKIVWYELCSAAGFNAYGKDDFFPNGSYITGKIISKDGTVQENIKLVS